MSKGVYEGDKSYRSIESDKMRVYIDSRFPRVIRYEWKSDNSILYGQEDSLSSVLINDVLYKPEVSCNNETDKAIYGLSFTDIHIQMQVEIKANSNILEFNILYISESENTKVYTIQFPNNALASVDSTQDKAVAAFTSLTGWNEANDEFITLDSDEIREEESDRIYAIVSTGKLAAAVDCNCIDDYKRLRVKTEKNNGVCKCSVFPGDWTYRKVDSEIVELPWAKVVIVDDINKDGMVDWQDGCIGYQSIIPDPLGADILRSSISHLAINFASFSQHPFLRILDNVKKLYLYIDGFNQMLLLKGYQSEGHDSSNLDYAGHYNERAGGLEDLRKLVQYSSKYNCFTGVHINHTESQPESHNHDNKVATENPGWAWLDQSWLIDKFYDVVSGNLYKRLEALKQDVPGLSWIYVDVYDPKGTEWEAWKLSSKINDIGMAVSSEYGGVFERKQIWAHTGLIHSKIMRFIRNHQQDLWMDNHNRFLLGYNHAGFMGWDAEKSIINVVRIFYTRNLPTKYMQNFKIKQWTGDFIIFEGGVVSKKENGTVNLYKNNRRIAGDDYTKIFIPWDPYKEDKIYHWNDEGGKSQWELPDSWASCEKVVLYLLSDTGRIMIDELMVDSGRVTVDAHANTPYVLYKTHQPKQEVEWGEGNIIKDPGFDSHGFSIWNKASSYKNTEHISIKNSKMGQSYLEIYGNNGADAVVSQTITDVVPNRTYQLSVWVEVENGRKATLGVKDFGGDELIKSITATDLPNFDSYSSKGACSTNFQRIRIYFTPREGYTTATVFLAANNGNPESKAKFDDVRIVPISPAPKEEHYYFEDFESFDEGWGPFVRGYGYQIHVHRSETHEGYTDDTISGKFSLKIFSGPEFYELDNEEIIRTVPSELLFRPNKEYKLSFKYKADNRNQYIVVVRTSKGGQINEVLKENLDKGNNVFSGSFTTNDFEDYYVAFIKRDKEQGNLVIDDFTVDD